VHLRIFTGFDASFRRETERDASYAAQKFHFPNFSSRRSRRTIYRRWECLAIIRPAALSERAPIPEQNFPNYRTVFDSIGRFLRKILGESSDIQRLASAGDEMPLFVPLTLPRLPHFYSHVGRSRMQRERHPSARGTCK